MRTWIVLFVVLGVVAAEPTEDGTPHVALQTALKRMGLDAEWYNAILILSKPTPSLELPAGFGNGATPSQQPNLHPQASLLQEGMSARARAEAEARAALAANPTYILPQNPWASNYPFPPPSPFAYNSYAPAAYGYSQPFANPSYAPGGGAPAAPNAGVAFTPGVAGGIAAPNSQDFFASTLNQPASRDPSFIYPAPNFVNPLYVSPRMPNGAFAYYAGFASAIPQGPLSDPAPFPVGENADSDFPKFRQLRRPAGVMSPTAFAEESSNQQREAQASQGQKTEDDKKSAAQQQQEQRRVPSASMPQKRFIRPDMEGSSKPAPKSNTKIVTDSKNMGECHNCHFAD